MDFQNKIAMITGAASGIGRATAEKLATHGCHLHLIDLDLPKLQVLQSQWSEHVDVTIYVGDVADDDFIQSVLAQIEAKHGRLDLAFNNAGITCEATTIGELKNDVWHKLLNTNLNSVFYCIKHQVKLMTKTNQGGAIVNTSSMLGLIGTKNRAAYITSKHAVTGLTKATALDYATQNIRVNSIHPGYIETPLIAHIDHEVLVAKHPVGRLGQSDEVADLVLFLLSDQAKFITGAQYVIDGGYSIL